MTVVRASARATKRGAAANFTGEVFQDEVLVGQLPSRMRATVVSFTPGARTGWHTHPGILLLTLAADSGPIDWYDANCVKTVYKAGDSWTESTKLHDVFNSSAMDAHFLVTYVVAKGVNKRTDQSAPACAAALGLP